MVRYGIDMNASRFGVKRSKVKVTLEWSMLETALSGLVYGCAFIVTGLIGLDWGSAVLDAVLTGWTLVMAVP